MLRVSDLLPGDKDLLKNAGIVMTGSGYQDTD